MLRMDIIMSPQRGLTNQYSICVTLNALVLHIFTAVCNPSLEMTKEIQCNCSFLGLNCVTHVKPLLFQVLMSLG